MQCFVSTAPWQSLVQSLGMLRCCCRTRTFWQGILFLCLFSRTGQGEPADSGRKDQQLAAFFSDTNSLLRRTPFLYTGMLPKVVKQRLWKYSKTGLASWQWRKKRGRNWQSSNQQPGRNQIVQDRVMTDRQNLGDATTKGGHAWTCRQPARIATCYHAFFEAKCPARQTNRSNSPCVNMRRQPTRISTFDVCLFIFNTT